MHFVKSLTRTGLAVLFIIMLWGQTAQSQLPKQPGRPPQPAPRPNSAPISLDGISPAQFRLLPPSARVIYKGIVMTKSDFIARRAKEWGASARAATSMPANITQPLDLQSEKSKFVQEQKSELAAKNASLQAEFEKSQQDARRLMQLPQYAALAKEAANLRDRFNKATADEKAKIKQRAAEVYSQLVRMEKTQTSGSAEGARQ